MILHWFSHLAFFWDQFQRSLGTDLILMTENELQKWCWHVLGSFFVVAFFKHDSVFGTSILVAKITSSHFTKFSSLTNRTNKCTFFRLLCCLTIASFTRGQNQKLNSVQKMIAFSVWTNLLVRNTKLVEVACTYTAEPKNERCHQKTLCEVGRLPWFRTAKGKTVKWSHFLGRIVSV